MKVTDICEVHGETRCATDLRLYGFADHCETPFGKDLCRFGDGTGIGEDDGEDEDNGAIR